MVLILRIARLSLTVGKQYSVDRIVYQFRKKPDTNPALPAEDQDTEVKL